MARKYNDHPFDVCIEKVTPFVMKGARFYQKWTCAHCKARNRMDIPNKFFQSGICEACGGQSPIVLCNYDLEISRR